MVCTSDFYYKNKIFDLSSPANRDNYYYPFYLLKNKFYEIDILLNTYDYLGESKDDAYKLLFFDIPKNINKYINIHCDKEKYLVIWESAIINPFNWKTSLHKHFKKIFTWNDDFIDNKKYFKINFSNKMPTNFDFNMEKKDKFCTMIARHKFGFHPLELYSERVKVIRWFEQNHPEDFDLYGIGWNDYYFKGVLSKLNRFEFLKIFFKPNYPSYNGAIQSKEKILQKYKFAICFENARNLPGYITEKIFDCFFAGCVPIYLGASNINEHIPKNTFIDRRYFKNYEELYKYLKRMSTTEYNNYLINIKEYLLSDKVYQFSGEYFAETITREITN